MSLDGKLLARAKDRLDKRRREHEEEMSRRRDEVYSASPTVRRLDAEMKSNMFRAVTAAMDSGGDPREALEAAREQNMTLREQRAMELDRLGLPMDYMESQYICPKCRDTGYEGTHICSCLMELYREEQRRELSGLLKLGRETFDTFDLRMYDDTYDPVLNNSPRVWMETVKQVCQSYAQHFSKKSGNLLLRGSTGLGKTFLSTCIAKEVSERGFSVVYDTAVNIFSRYEAEKFGRGDPDEAARDIKRYETCDLLIIDDLGAEFPTAFVTAALYALLNARLMTDRKLVINTNLTLPELESRYSPAIYSRLIGQFQLAEFFGKDIRLIKNKMNG